ncbi:pyridoxamine 5'-phosphate oxidase family protein [Streptomyces sp. CBMA152]|uniref:pyridoxamine 5'-phosphate oxidase family protein n=1 Tax=Streptomyces sp. CBMA152 TaxID=1896312 RepID=UPI0016615F1F|nr:pyridoxamine 5'-phosphate oxidase family protein [Streptomyces sp. CBMA152]MBD0747110.1 flavin-nucleotide-binding protein [Streptomyces sp. CBMA152]
MSTQEQNQQLAVTERTRHRRLREQGSTSVADLDAILRAGFVCHLGVVVDGVPMVVPTVYGVDFGTRTLYVHGSVASRSLVQAPDATVCVTVTHIDGLVLARSVFEHGVNYRSAMVYAVPRLIADGDELLHGLRVVTEQCAPGQWEYARRPNRKELAATSLLALSLDEASVKTASGPPQDGDGPDGELGLWAGVIPMRSYFDAPEPDPALPAGIALPPHVAALGPGRSGS